MIWKVRPSPKCARSNDGSRSMRLPSKRTRPPSARIIPVIRLNAVVLPEPFGPISAVIVPSCTWKVRSSTARRPPKLFASPSTSSSMRGSVGTASRGRAGRREGRRSIAPETIAPAERSASPFAQRATDGTTPCGRKRTTAAITAPYTTRFICVVPKWTFASSLRICTAKPPRIGPITVPRPPRSAASTISTLFWMLNMPR